MFIKKTLFKFYTHKIDFNIKELYNNVNILRSELPFMNEKILFVSTSKNMADIAKDSAKKIGINIHVHDGGILKSGHIYAQQHEQDYDVIISHGNSAESIRRLVKIPVVSIEITIANVLNTLLKAKKYGNTVALILFKHDSLKELYMLNGILNINFELFTYTNNIELRNSINKAVNSGLTSLVGIGDCIIEEAAKYNVNAISIECDRKGIESALNSAKNISDLSKRERELNKRYKNILDHSNNGVLTIDSNNKIITLNSLAEKIFNVKTSEIINNSILTIAPFKVIADTMTNEKITFNKIVEINNNKFIANIIPIIMENDEYNTIISLQEVSKLQQLELKVRSQLYKKGLYAKYHLEDIVGESKELKELKTKIKKIAKTDTTVLILAETGSGKELFAQSIHNISLRKNGPFVTVNCAAMPENLLESELFGYEEGAFTGAKKGGRPGLFELAHNGTIFLDEVSELPLSLQGRLLRVLQEKEILRIGGDYILNVNIRVIAATNKNLLNMVNEGKFRQDLYYRLNVIDVIIPPLRERKEDIPNLANMFLDRMNDKYDTKISPVSNEIIKILTIYNWPGNVRQLENFIEKSAILSDGFSIDPIFVTNSLLNEENYFKKNTVYENVRNDNRNEDDSISIRLSSLSDIELQVIEQASKIYKGDKSDLANILGISRSTLWKRLKQIEESYES